MDGLIIRYRLFMKTFAFYSYQLFTPKNFMLLDNILRHKLVQQKRFGEVKGQVLEARKGACEDGSSCETKCYPSTALIILCNHCMITYYPLQSLLR